MKWYNIIKELTPEEEEAAVDFLIEEDEGYTSTVPQGWHPRPRISLEGQKAEEEISRLLEEIEAAQQKIKDLRKLVEEEE
jgi:hypothetical protein